MDGIDVMHASIVCGFAVMGSLITKKAPTKIIILGTLLAVIVSAAGGGIAYYIINGAL